MILGSFHYLTKKKKKKIQVTNSNFEENPQVSCVSKKDEREEVENKLPKEYEPLFIPQRIMTLQHVSFHSICTFFVNKHIFIQ